ncbi:hypothetical protein H9C73_04080 [Marinobacterium sp. AK62]|uniref:Uncharacterized protein n=1 Tax=Marinobacterium alkalitolerans TaxID=1542925 RepID=A0ABS3Z867_9GAMM|nr:hypothetical protein [Marinobacterium alkalitolerans]MBP0047902.1 hypothetical protein [Marinobacterium alkalitolerans]
MPSSILRLSLALLLLALSWLALPEVRQDVDIQLSLEPVAMESALADSAPADTDDPALHQPLNIQVCKSAFIAQERDPLIPPFSFSTPRARAPPRLA